METNKFENSPNYGAIIWWSICNTIVVIIAEIWIIIRNSPDGVLALILGIVFWSILFYLIPFDLHIRHRPKSVEISEDGVKMYMRLGMKPIFTAWSDIRIIGSSTSIMGKENGAIYNDIRWYYRIDHPIYLELKDAYLKQMGHYPPANFDDLCPGMEKDRLTMSSRQWTKKYERFKKK